MRNLILKIKKIFMAALWISEIEFNRKDLDVYVRYILCDDGVVCI